jgi:hypothetical protein
MARDHWDAILASSPLNATAGAVTGKGVHFEPTEMTEETTWDAPPPLIAIPKERRELPTFVDLTGKRIGRLTVLGMVETGRWACRCVCGRYIARKGRGILKQGDEAMCNACNYTTHLRFNASGNRARERAESEKARKWTPAEADEEGKQHDPLDSRQ